MILRCVDAKNKGIIEHLFVTGCLSELYKKELEQETDERCRMLQEDYAKLIRRIGSKEAVTRRFFLIFEYELWNGSGNSRRGNEESEVILSLQTAARTAANYLRQCGNEVIIPDNEDEFTTDILYNLLNRKTSGDKPLSVRTNEVTGKYIANGNPENVNNIPSVEFFAPDSIDCQQRLPRQYKPEDIKGLILGDNMELAYQMLTGTGEVKRNYFILDGNYDNFIYLTNDRKGELLLKLICDQEKVAQLNQVLSENLYPHNAAMTIENDAIDENGEPVLFGYDFDMSRIIRFNKALGIQNKTGTIICFDFQADALKRFCGERVK